MTRILAAALLTASAVTAFATPAHAQEIKAEDAAQLRAQLAAMKAQIAALEARVAVTDRTAQDAGKAAAIAGDKAQAATAVATQASTAAKSVPTIAWKGAPEFEGEGGWSFKPRGRLQYDAASVGSPNGVTDPGLGFSNEVRRARLGVEGDIPGGFGYKFEVDFAGNKTDITDAILTYKDKGLGITVGQHNNFQSLEELTSSRFLTMMERAAFTDAFNFERRVGVSANYKSGAVLVQGGVFTDGISALNNDANNSYGFDGRVVYMPKMGATQLHLGASAHYRDLNDAAATVRYRQRPFVHTSDTRFLDTGSISASAEKSYGLEAAAINGPFHVAGEAYWQNVVRPGLADPTFFGGYAEVGYFLTKGDTRGYKNGTFDRVKPKNGFEKGGLGAVQVNLRYDYLDLNDGPILGGKQNGYAASIVWTPTAYTRFMANYGRMQYDNAAIPAAGGNRSYGINVFGVRSQIDF